MLLAIGTRKTDMHEQELIGAADIGGTTIKSGLFRTDGRLLKSWEIPTDLSDHGSRILKDLCSSLKEAAADCRLKAVGIAVPAAVDEQGTARSCTNIGWGTVRLPEAVKPLLPETDILCFGNDATMAAFGELNYGIAGNYGSVYMITLGTGVGGGYAFDKRVVNGAFGAAGEIGHIIINPWESTPCSCGRRGCLEQYASAKGVVRLADNILRLQRVKTNGAKTADRPELHIERLFDLDIPKEQSQLSELETFTAKDICALADAGDALSSYILKIFGRCIGLAMSSISCSIDPECYIIGGGMSRSGETVLKAIREGYACYAYPASAGVSIIQAELGNAAGIYGCAAAVLQACRQSDGIEHQRKTD